MSDWEKEFIQNYAYQQAERYEFVKEHWDKAFKKFTPGSLEPNVFFEYMSYLWTNLYNLKPILKAADLPEDFIETIDKNVVLLKECHQHIFNKDKQ
jgi:tetratricopeptide (TPR) repeat protein